MKMYTMEGETFTVLEDIEDFIMRNLTVEEVEELVAFLLTQEDGEVEVAKLGS